MKSNDLNSNGDRRKSRNHASKSGNYDHLDINDIRIGVEPSESFHSGQIQKALMARPKSTILKKESSVKKLKNPSMKKSPTKESLFDSPGKLAFKTLMSTQQSSAGLYNNTLGKTNTLNTFSKKRPSTALKKPT